MSRRSLQDTNVSSDPSIWLPAIISEAETLATSCEALKALASKLQVIWSKKCKEVDGNSCHQQKDKVDYCRKLRKAVDTTCLNSKSLQDLMVKIELAIEIEYGNTADTEVDQQESCMAKEEDDKRPIVKKLSGANSKQDNYTGFHAGMPESPPSATSNSTKDSSSESETFVNGTGISVIRAFCTDSDSDLELSMEIDYYETIESTEEASVIRAFCTDSDSDSDLELSMEIADNETIESTEEAIVSSPDKDLNAKADSDDSLARPPKKRRKRIENRIKIPRECEGDPKLKSQCFKIEPEENNNDPVKVIMDVIPSTPAVLSEV